MTDDSEGLLAAEAERVLTEQSQCRFKIGKAISEKVETRSNGVLAGAELFNSSIAIVHVNLDKSSGKRDEQQNGRFYRRQLGQEQRRLDRKKKQQTH